MTERKASITDRIYERDPLVKEFNCTVLSCKKAVEGFEIILDRTAFFPTGGGQSCDTGSLNGISVTDVFCRDGDILHITSAPIDEGAKAVGVLDYSERVEKMEAHTAEHILSSVLNRSHGLNNVGFHIGHVDITCDFDRHLTDGELAGAEDEVNRIIREDHPVYAVFPSKEELCGISYRSKLDLEDDVRIVCIGEGGSVDKCACCAPHVISTGRIGLFRIIDFYRYKGGMRVHILTGQKALSRARDEAMGMKKLSSLLSAKPEPDSVISATERLMEENRSLSVSLSMANDMINSALCLTVKEGSDAVIFDIRTDTDVLRRLCIAAKEKCGKTACIFGGGDGEYRFVLCGERASEAFEALKMNFSARGGGKDVICGSVGTSENELRAVIGTLTE